MLGRYSLLLVVLVLTGCGLLPPRTEYRFTPPTTDTGRLCIVTCENIQSQCRYAEDEKKRDCDRRVEMRRLIEENCRMNAKGGDASHCYSDNSLLYYCPPANYSQCEYRYRACYQTCGGTVEAYEVAR